MKKYRLDYTYTVKANRGAYMQEVKYTFSIVNAKSEQEAINDFKKYATAIDIINIKSLELN